MSIRAHCNYHTITVPITITILLLLPSLPYDTMLTTIFTTGDAAGMRGARLPHLWVHYRADRRRDQGPPG